MIVSYLVCWMIHYEDNGGVPIVLQAFTVLTIIILHIVIHSINVIYQKLHEVRADLVQHKLYVCVMFLALPFLGSGLSEELWVLQVALYTASSYSTCSLILEGSEIAQAILFLVIKINSFCLEPHLILVYMCNVFGHFNRSFIICYIFIFVLISLSELNCNLSFGDIYGWQTISPKIHFLSGYLFEENF